MVSHVAVVHVRVFSAGEVVKTGDENDCFVDTDIKGNFPALFVFGHRAAAARDDLELHIMDVEGMAKDFPIGDRPLFNRVQHHRLVDDIHVKARVVESEGGAGAPIGYGKCALAGDIIDCPVGYPDCGLSASKVSIKPRKNKRWKFLVIQIGSSEVTCSSHHFKLCSSAPLK